MVSNHSKPGTADDGITMPVKVRRDFGRWGRPDEPPPKFRSIRLAPPPAFNPWVDDPFGIGLNYHLP